MTRIRRLFLGLILGAAPWATQAATITLAAGGNLTRAIECAAVGDTLQLPAGVYPLQDTPAWNDRSFAIGKRINIVGLGATPGDVILRGAANSTFTVKFVQYTMPAENCAAGGAFQTTLTPGGSTLENLTIDSGAGGAQIYSPGLRLTDITLKDVVIRTTANGGQQGALVQDADAIVLDNVTVTSNQAGLFFVNTNDSLVMNSTVTGTGPDASSPGRGAPTLVVFGGTRNRFVNNTFGSPKANPSVDAGYSVNAGNITFYNTTANRFENNTVQGHADDGLDFIPNVGAFASAPAAKATDNYVGKNKVVSTGHAAGRPGGSSIWTSCGSDNTWLYANESSGAAECGLCVWTSSSNMVLANTFNDNKLGGIVVSGGAETKPTFLCPVAAYAVRPQSTFIRSNNIFFNPNYQLLVRNADKTDMSLNYLSPRNGLGGPLACTPNNVTLFCPAAFNLETDATEPKSEGYRIAENISAGNNLGLWNRDGKSSGLEFIRNRVFASTFNSFVTPSALNFDAGPVLGGNYWSQHTAAGNPSSSTPYSAIFQSTANATGLIVDRHPFQSEDLGRGGSVAVFEPRLNLAAAQGTRRTVRWYAPGCIYADITLDGVTPLATNAPNTGYAVVTIPGSASIAPHFMRVTCKSSAGATLGQGDSPAFNVTSSALKLLSPGRDDVFNAGDTIFAAWKKAAGVAGVTVEFSADGGANFTPLATGVTKTFAKVTIPANTPSTAYGVIRVSSGANSDAADGVFAVRGTSGAGFSNVTAGRSFTMGRMERLEWASPQGSRLVTIAAAVGANSRTIAENLPDRGNFDWIVDDFGAGTLNLTITFMRTNGARIGDPLLNSLGRTVYATSATPNPPRLVNIATRGRVQSGANVLIAGFVIGGTTPKKVLVTARGPSVAVLPTETPLLMADPKMTLYNAGGPFDSNDSWQSRPNWRDIPTSQRPGDNKDAAILATLAPGAYTAIVEGVGGATGLTIVEVFEVENPDVPLINIATRGRVEPGANVMIAGFVIGGTANMTVLVTARGPSVAVLPAEQPLLMADPKLTLFNAAGPFDSNDDWQTRPNWQNIPMAQRPGSNKDAAILVSLPPGAYTAIVEGVGNTSGIAIVEVFAQ